MKYKLFLLLILSHLVVGQHRNCGLVKAMATKMQNDEYAKRHQALQDKFQYRLSHPISNRNAVDVIKIPVAVHFPESNEQDRACLEALAQEQIEILNQDYKGINSDISLWNNASSFYPGVNTGSFNIQFEIATQNHPVISGITNGNKLVTIGYAFQNTATNDDSDTNYRGYLNIVVRDLYDTETNDPLLGLSPLGGNPAVGESVIIGLQSFGTGTGCGIVTPQAPFNKGRTLTHELGHYFNLDHTFGDESDCTSNSDDSIADTPKIADPNYLCPNYGSITACDPLKKALTMNYMDYTDDECMFMFTQGQVNYSMSYINTVASSFKSNSFSLATTAFADNEFRLFPNPIIDNLTIDFTEKQSDLKLTISDLSGRTILYNKYKSSINSLYLNNLSLKSGTYILTIVSEGKTLNQKIMVY